MFINSGTTKISIPNKDVFNGSRKYIPTARPILQKIIRAQFVLNMIVRNLVLAFIESARAVPNAIIASIVNNTRTTTRNHVFSPSTFLKICVMPTSIRPMEPRIFITRVLRYSIIIHAFIKLYLEKGASLMRTATNHFVPIYTLHPKNLAQADLCSPQLPLPTRRLSSVSYTHLTLPTNREV